MYAVVDNFLSEETFNSLNERMLWRFKPELSQFRPTRSTQVKNPPATLKVPTDGIDHNEAAIVLGPMVPSIVEQVKTYLINELKQVSPLTYTIWFQYMSKYHRVGKHYDNGTLRGKEPTQCFSTFIYAHNEWEDDWGGELCFNTEKVLPKRNRMIVYSRDEEHWVEEIKHDKDTFQRMFLGISWSTDNVLV